MRDTVVLPNAPILVESTRAIGYSFESALADIIDNSIGKGAKNIKILFDSTETQYVAVIDDASGMNERELISAMRYGSKSSLDERDQYDLGRFGLGLKTASLSSPIFLIFSKFFEFFLRIFLSYFEFLCSLLPILKGIKTLFF